MIARVLTIAGSDSSGGAGIQADLKTFTVFRAFGMSAITALTAQNTRGVTGISPVAPEFVRAQIDAVATDVGVDAAKTGMLLSAAIISVVSDAVRAHRIENLVVDPVMIAQSGAALLEPEAQTTLRERLIPLARVVTPNTPEAESLLGMPVAGVADMREAARRFVSMGARAALVKGGHLDGPEAVDVLCDGGRFHEFRSPRIDTPHTHAPGVCCPRPSPPVWHKGCPSSMPSPAPAFHQCRGGPWVGDRPRTRPGQPLAWLDEVS